MSVVSRVGIERERGRPESCSSKFVLTPNYSSSAFIIYLCVRAKKKRPGGGVRMPGRRKRGSVVDMGLVQQLSSSGMRGTHVGPSRDEERGRAGSRWLLASHPSDGLD